MWMDEIITPPFNRTETDSVSTVIPWIRFQFFWTVRAYFRIFRVDNRQKTPYLILGQSKPIAKIVNSKKL